MKKIPRTGSAADPRKSMASVGRSGPSHRCCTLMYTTIVVAALVFAVSATGAQVRQLSGLQDQLHIDTQAVSVSGISSGAYMAQQFQVVYSSRIMGAGLLAGGPYHCAGGAYFLSLLDPTDLYAALNVCTASNPMGLFAGPPDVQQSIDFTREQAQAKRIDDPVNLRSARIWLFSGSKDETVPLPVVESLAEYYRTFLSPDRIRLVTLPGAAHAMITDHFGSACGAQGTPYINDCNFAAAERLLQYIYGPDSLAPKVSQTNPGSLITFDQTPFFDASNKRVSLHRFGHLYVPSRCRQGASCRLHVAFHGCMQSQDAIGDAFYAHAGYNEMAEANAIVVLYPQVKAWTESLLFQYTENPRGCWDWWGYSGKDYSVRSGRQIQAVARMVNALVGENLLPRE